MPSLVSFLNFKNLLTHLLWLLLSILEALHTSQSLSLQVLQSISSQPSLSRWKVRVSTPVEEVTKDGGWGVRREARRAGRASRAPTLNLPRPETAAGRTRGSCSSLHWGVERSWRGPGKTARGGTRARCLRPGTTAAASPVGASAWGSCTPIFAFSCRRLCKSVLVEAGTWNRWINCLRNAHLVFFFDSKWINS